MFSNHYWENWIESLIKRVFHCTHYEIISAQFHVPLLSPLLTRSTCKHIEMSLTNLHCTKFYILRWLRSVHLNIWHNFSFISPIKGFSLHSLQYVNPIIRQNHLKCLSDSSRQPPSDPPVTQIYNILPPSSFIFPDFSMIYWKPEIQRPGCRIITMSQTIYWKQTIDNQYSKGELSYSIPTERFSDIDDMSNSGFRRYFC